MDGRVCVECLLCACDVKGKCGDSCYSAVLGCGYVNSTRGTRTYTFGVDSNIFRKENMRSLHSSAPPKSEATTFILALLDNAVNVASKLVVCF